MIDYYEPKLELSLLGCGFLGSYHVGAICLLSQIWPQRPYTKLCGASCGGLLAALLLAGLSLDKTLLEAMAVIRKLKAAFRNPARIISLTYLVETQLELLLPENAHKLCSGRLGISLTKLWPFENKFVSQFETRQELLDAIIAGCFIPLWSGLFAPIPKFRGHYCIDGAYSDNCPKFELTRLQKESGVRQIQVSPFGIDQLDVAPRDLDSWRPFSVRIMGSRYHFSWPNLIRSIQAMSVFGAYKPYLLAGHRDMKEFVLRNRLVKCLACCEKSEAAHKAACLFCLRLLERVDSLEVPEELVRSME